jgi:predicted dinucleotide-binding enzyme
MKIGILGGSKLAVALGVKFIDLGINVTFGVHKDFEIKELGWKVLNLFPEKLGTLERAIKEADIILICCENEQLTTYISKLKLAKLHGKIILDCTNSSSYSNSESNTAKIFSELKDVLLFKAFNNLGLDYPQSDKMGMINETYICGPNGSEKIKVKRLIELIGFKAIDTGGLENSMLLEALYHLNKNITQYKNDKSNYHFKLISS